MAFVIFFISNTLEVLNKINYQTIGRDKLARLIQYSSRLIRHQLEYRSTDKFILERLRYVEHSTGQFRRLMRMGRCFEIAYSTLDGFVAIDDPVLKLTITIRKLAISLFLYCDHLIWFIRHSFMVGDCEKWYKRANQFWCLSIVANLCRDFYEITIIYETHVTLCRKYGNCRNVGISNDNLFVRLLANLRFLMSLHIQLILDVIRNLSDLFIPLTSLGFVNLNATSIGLCGTISSIISLVQIIHPEYRLWPC